ncbi:unnamed protein product [Rhodiola kirilowii]
MITRFQGKKHVTIGSSSDTSQPPVKRGRGRPRKNPIQPVIPIPPVVQDLIMEDDNDNHPVLPRDNRNRRIDGDGIEDPPAREENDNARHPRRNPPIPRRENRNDRYEEEDEDEDERPVGDYMIPTLRGNGSVIQPLEEDAFDFDVKSSLIHIITNDQFQGQGNPSTHLANFQENCRMYKPRNVPLENVYLKLFPSVFIWRC